MRAGFTDLLADPAARTPLALKHATVSDDTIVDGVLEGAAGRQYAIRNGIPRFVESGDEAQAQTADAFGYKWEQRDSYDSPGMRELLVPWTVEKYGFATPEEMRDHLASADGPVLDAGCGGGLTASLYLDRSWTGSYVGMDISSAVDVAASRIGGIAGTDFVQADILAMPFADGTFGAVFSEGVMHHTPSTRDALHELTRVLKPGGEILFYVYRRKGPMREFADDHIRSVLADMSPQEAWEAMRPLTKLAKALSDLHVEVEVEEDIPYLGISAGRIDVQRLLYWDFLKLYWNDMLSFEENNHVNFDWYAPMYAHRQTEEQVRGWCAEEGLSIHRFHVQESGFTVRATKARPIGRERHDG